ncbi:MAG: transcriptional repressor NrdR [Caldilineae bacterium]|nr:MAG: transcriptional repressor NrdR [Caldilineae bacterium]
MKCPYCNSSESRVIDTRDVPDGVRRRRECSDCHQRFTTYERIATINLLIVKRDGRREEFDRDKLLKSMRIACSKRAVSAEQLEQAVRDIEAALYTIGKGEIKSLLVGRLVMDHLQKIDDVAYVRYASVYRRFQDVTNMAEEIQQLLERKRREEEQKNQIPLPLQAET